MFYTMKRLEWLDWQDNRMNYVYTSDGLVVGCEIHSNSDGSVKNPISALRFIPRHCGVPISAPHSSGFSSLDLGPFFETISNRTFYRFINSNESNKSLRMQIWQFYINGEKPEKIHGSADDKINVFFKNGLSQNFPHVGKFNPSRPKMINSYLYSGKAVDLMKEKKRSHVDIEKVIKFGKLIREGHYLTYYAKGEKLILSKTCIG